MKALTVTHGRSISQMKALTVTHGRSISQMKSRVAFMIILFMLQTMNTLIKFVFSVTNMVAKIKNIVLAMAMIWLGRSPERIQTLVIFPVRGHSFLPCDRLFGRIEQDIKLIESITPSTVYHDVVWKTLRKCQTTGH